MPEFSPSLFEGIHKLPAAVKGMIWKESNVPLASLKSDDKFVPSGKQMVSDVQEALKKEKITKAEHDNAALEIVKASAGSPHEVGALSEYLKSAQKDPSLLTSEIHSHSLFTPERVHEWTPEFTEGTIAAFKHAPPEVQRKWGDLIKQSPQLTEQLEKKCGTKTLDLESPAHQRAIIELMPDMLPKSQKFAADAIEKTQVHRDAVAALNSRPNAKTANDQELFQALQTENHDKDRVFRLLRSDRNPEYINYHFQAASLKGNTEAVQYLGGRGVNKELKNQQFFHALDNQPTNMVRALAEAGADVNIKDPSTGNTPFLHTVASKKLDMAQTLAEVGADVKATNNAQQSAMHLVADQGNAKAVPILHGLGVPVDAVNKEGSTPAHLAAYKGAEEAVRELHRLGANINHKDPYGETPLDFALSEQFADRSKTIRTLEELGAKKGSELP